MSLIEDARAALEGVTAGPWRAEQSKYVRGWYIVSPSSATVVHATEWQGDFAPADYKFVAAARTLVPALVRALEAASDVATTRQNLIDQLKAEKRQLVHEVRRLTVNAGCLGCGDAASDGHTCRRW